MRVRPPVPNIATLRDRVAQTWVALDEGEVRHICQGFWRRLEAMITEEGGHINL